MKRQYKYWADAILKKQFPIISSLTHWGRVTHICVGNLTIIGPDNGLSPGRRQAIIWSNAIQIKICAEYRDMLPRPRLVCQEPGLRPIGRSPGVPDKSSRGLGSMSRYSAQILICFIAYISLFFGVSSVGLVGNCTELPSCTVPSAIGHCNQNEAGHQTIKAPSMPCWGAAGLLNSLWHLCHRTGEIDR